MNISDLCREAHKIALEKGWYDPPKSFGEMILMCHTELSEVIGEYRQAKSSVDLYGIRYENLSGKPIGVAVELADLVIRVADLCENYNIDLESAIEEKLEYNKTREYRHGGKRL